MEVLFLDPTPELAAYQRARSLGHMVQTLRASKADLTSLHSVAVSLAEASYDPFLIGLLGGQAAKIAAMQKGFRRVH